MLLVVIDLCVLDEKTLFLFLSHENGWKIQTFNMIVLLIQAIHMIVGLVFICFCVSVAHYIEDWICWCSWLVLLWLLSFSFHLSYIFFLLYWPLTMCVSMCEQWARLVSIVWCMTIDTTFMVIVFTMRLIAIFICLRIAICLSLTSSGAMIISLSLIFQVLTMQWMTEFFCFAPVFFQW